MKTIIHAYKSGDQWIHSSPPGLGDFIRGTCHLFERLDGTGCVLKVDISQTTFSELIDFDEVIAGRPYELLSIRTGDGFVANGRGRNGVRGDLKRILFSLIENRIIAHSHSPIVVMSDSHELKKELARRYSFIVFPHAPHHGSSGNALPVSIDIHLLRNSNFNWHINAWQPWWSGFSHYTSLIFTIPSANFRTPLFIREEITSLGVLRISLIGRFLLAVGRVCSYPRRLWQAVFGGARPMTDVAMG